MNKYFIFLLFTFLFQQTIAQNFSEVLIELEKNTSIQSEAKKMCMAKEMPLSIYVKDKALIEAFLIEDNQPIYGVITNFLSPSEGGYLSTWDDIQKEFDLDNAQMNYGNGKIINDGSIKRHPSNPNATGQVLLIPESTNDRIMAFDPITGNLIDADFIPSDASNISTPIASIPISASDPRIIVSDQVEDAIQIYDASGMFTGTFFGGDVNILDNIRGINHSSDFNSILSTVGGGVNAGAIAEFDLSGAYLGNLINPGTGGIDSPFDIEYHPILDAYLVGDINLDKILLFNTDGTFRSDFADIDNFPEQITVFEDGRIGVGNFSGTEDGVVIYDMAGNILFFIDPATLSGFRGVYLLGNGNILTTNSGGVHEIDFMGNLVESKITGVSARFIHESIASDASAEVPTLGQWGLIILCILILIFGVEAISKKKVQLSIQKQ